MLRRAVRAFREQRSLSEDEGLRWLWLACIAAAHIWDDEPGRALAPASSSSPGTPAHSPCSPSRSASASACTSYAGELAAAASLLQELDVGHRGDREPPRALRRPCCSRRGGAGKPRRVELIEATLDEVLRRGEGIGLTVARLAEAVLYERARPVRGRAGRCRSGEPAPAGDGRAHLGRADRAHRSRCSAAGCASVPATASAGSRRRPAPAAPTGRWASRPAPVPCSPTDRQPRAPIAKRSTASAAPAFAASSRVPI